MKPSVFLAENLKDEKMMIVAFSKFGLAAFRPSAARGFSCAPDFARRLFSTRLPQENELRSLHELWMAEYGRVYKTPEEKEMRFQLFKGAVAYACKKKPDAAVPELLEHLNGLADYADKEFELMCGSISPIPHPKYYKRQR
uniref:Cathepsin propeptide inhibitor domain-containing protein n=1 Tax=Kalanchoe fedtschenkoi TaxID=63787 RepID=A0A7N0TXM6_KALFE